MTSIQGVFAQEILDSRGLPTVECTVWLDNGALATSSSPSGTSVGKYEALEKRDGIPEYMLGKGVSQAVTSINTEIAPALLGKDPSDQQGIDAMLQEMDGTSNKKNLGANTTIAVSQAVMKAAAAGFGLPTYSYIFQKYQMVQTLFMPTCIYTMINGGSHGADNLDIQEFQIIPASYLDFEASLNMAVTIFHKLDQVLALKGAIRSTGMVGGFTPNLYNNSDVFEILIETIKTTQYTFAQDVFFGIDAAASEFYQNGKYTLKDKSQPYTSEELLQFYKKIRSVYNVYMIEDPFFDDDEGTWQQLTQEVGDTTKIMADSFLATNKDRTKKAIDEKQCNSILVKPNQAGTITETLEVIRLAQAAGWDVIMSHRSGETLDDFIADLAVGTGCTYTKFGPPNRGERVAKYNRLRQISADITLSNQTGPAPTTTESSGS